MAKALAGETHGRTGGERYLYGQVAEEMAKCFLNQRIPSQLGKCNSICSLSYQKALIIQHWFFNKLKEIRVKNEVINIQANREDVCYSEIEEMTPTPLKHQSDLKPKLLS